MRSARPTGLRRAHPLDTAHARDVSMGKQADRCRRDTPVVHHRRWWASEVLRQAQQRAEVESRGREEEA